MAFVQITSNRNIEVELLRLKKELSKLPQESLKEFKALTPIRSGNARSKTRLQGQNTISADYQYAQRLDEGHSRQAPEGMTKPFEEWFEKQVNKKFRK